MVTPDRCVRLSRRAQMPENWAGCPANRVGGTIFGQSRGEAHYNAKLIEADILRIFRLRGTGLTQARIASEYGVSSVLISQILSRKVWAHVALREDLAPSNFSAKALEVYDDNDR